MLPYPARWGHGNSLGKACPPVGGAGYLLNVLSSPTTHLMTLSGVQDRFLRWPLGCRGYGKKIGVPLYGAPQERLYVTNDRR